MTGPKSACFHSSALSVKNRLDRKIDIPEKVRCHKFKCENNGQTLKIYYMKDKYVFCTQEMLGNEIPTDPIYFRGTITCPEDFEPYCQFRKYNHCMDLNYCSGNGVCLNNQCQCINGFEGEDCSKLPIKIDELIE